MRICVFGFSRAGSRSRVRFTGQQPGEEGVEKDEKPGPGDVIDEDDRSRKRDETMGR
jgi:hypothetical protein